MTTTEPHGTTFRGEVPNWDPLLALACDHICDFMWMFEVELEDGTRLHAHKHRQTRRYLHLTCDGRAFVFCGDDRYREEAPQRLLHQVLA